MPATLAPGAGTLHPVSGRELLLPAALHSLQPHERLPQEEARPCTDVEPPPDWEHPSCAAQLFNSKCPVANGYCEATCGVCYPMRIQPRPHTLNDVAMASSL